MNERIARAGSVGWVGVAAAGPADTGKAALLRPLSNGPPLAKTRAHRENWKLNSIRSPHKAELRSALHDADAEVNIPVDEGHAARAWEVRSPRSDGIDDYRRGRRQMAGGHGGAWSFGYRRATGTLELPVEGKFPIRSETGNGGLWFQGSGLGGSESGNSTYFQIRKEFGVSDKANQEHRVARSLRQSQSSRSRRRRRGMAGIGCVVSQVLGHERGLEIKELRKARRDMRRYSQLFIYARAERPRDATGGKPPMGAGTNAYLRLRMIGGRVGRTYGTGLRRERPPRERMRGGDSTAT